MTTKAPRVRRATRADQALTEALTELAAEGRRPPCAADPGTTGWWTSDDPDERQAAAYRCHGCPLMSVCRQAADTNRERFGVWAGVDYGATDTTTKEN